VLIGMTLQIVDKPLTLAMKIMVLKDSITEIILEWDEKLLAQKLIKNNPKLLFWGDSTPPVKI